MAYVEPPKVELLVDGTRYAGWTSIRVTRGIEHMSAAFTVEVSERWPGRSEPWVIKPGAACVLSLGGHVVITGHVDAYEPKFDGESHSVSITGRSKTADLVDSSVVVKGGQYKGYDLAQIARAVAAPFGISARVETDVGAAFPDVQVQQGETAFELIDRLCSMRGLLATDAPDGALVLTRAGETRAVGRLVQGGTTANIQSASAKLDHSKRMSRYILKGQQSATDNLFGDEAAGVTAEAVDPAVTRYRPLLIVAEAESDGATAAERARWEAVSRAGKAVQATVTVPGWFQDAERTRLWIVNEVVSVSAPWLGIDRELLVGEITYSLSETEGTTVEMTLSPPEAFTPSREKRREKRATGATRNPACGPT